MRVTLSQRQADQVESALLLAYGYSESHPDGQTHREVTIACRTMRKAIEASKKKPQ